MPAFRDALFASGLAFAAAAAAGALACDGGAPAPAPSDGGNVLQINGLIDHCPVIQSIGVSPSLVTVGKPAMVSAIATDQDVGDVLSFVWTTGNGTFTTPEQATTSYTCATPGMPTVTLDVSDGRCLSRSAVAVTCQSAAD